MLQQASSRRHKEKPKFMDSHPYGYDDRCYDELREVLRESLARQNLLPKVSVRDRPERKTSDDLCMDMHSSSSSQSSLVCSRSSNCSPASSSSNVQREKPKGPNLIAKLMGLEEAPLRAASNSKLMEKEKYLNHLLDIDLPGPKKKPQFMMQRVLQDRRTLYNMIEKMQFKGPEEINDSIGGNCHRDGVSFLRKRLGVEGPPIVIMRPRHVHEDHSNDETHVKTQNMREIFLPCALEVPKGPLNIMARNKKLAGERLPKQKLNKLKEEKHSGQFRAKKYSKPSPMKTKDSKPPVRRNAAVDDKRKVALNSRKLAETKDAKSQGSIITQDVGQLTTLKLSKVVKESNDLKSQVARGKVAATNEKIIRTSLESSIPKKKIQKSKCDRKPSEALVENISSHDRFPVNIESSIPGPSEQITEEVMNASCSSISDNSGDTVISPCEPSEAKSKGDLSGVEDGSCVSCLNLDETKSCKSITNTRRLPLSSVSFFNLMVELFDTNSTILPTDDGEVLDDSLLLDCAKEMLVHKSLRYSRMRNLFSQNLLKRPKCNECIEEISDGIEYLRNYSKSCGGHVYSMLERDLWWNEEVTSAWDSGWRDGYTTETTNEVVHDIEKLVLSEFIADVVTELMPRQSFAYNF